MDTIRGVRTSRCPHGYPHTREFACPVCVTKLRIGLGAVEKRRKPPVQAVSSNVLSAREPGEPFRYTADGLECRETERLFCPTDEYRHLLTDDTRARLEAREARDGR